VQLLVVVLHREELLDDVLSALVELELPDAVVIESRTSLELLERDLPIFAGIRSLIPGGIDFSRVVLCLVEDDDLAGAALGAIRELGDCEAPTGEPVNTAMLVPVTGMEHF
jgi:nitrogen regulatory protein P-II 1